MLDNRPYVYLHAERLSFDRRSCCGVWSPDCLSAGFPSRVSRSSRVDVSGPDRRKRRREGAVARDWACSEGVVLEVDDAIGSELIELAASDGVDLVGPDRVASAVQ